MTDDEVVQPLKAVIRVATPEDDRIEERNHEKEKEAYKICLEKIRKTWSRDETGTRQSIRLTTINCCFILPQMEESISVNW